MQVTQEGGSTEEFTGQYICREQSGTISTGSGSTLQSRPRSARGPFGETLDLTDFDNATKEILQECMRIRLNIPAASLNNQLTKEDWECHWRRAKEETSSSVSGRHFGHYKAGLWSAYISHTQALISSLVTKEGLVLERWSQGLSVMSEKIPGCALINKLRSILLMEADFNATNRVLYGVRLLATIRKHKLMPEEIYS